LRIWASNNNLYRANLNFRCVLWCIFSPSWTCFFRQLEEAQSLQRIDARMIMSVAAFILHALLISF